MPLRMLKIVNKTQPDVLSSSTHAGPKEGRGGKEQAVLKWESFTKHATYKSQVNFFTQFCVKSFLKYIRSRTAILAMKSVAKCMCELPTKPTATLRIFLAW